MSLGLGPVFILTTDLIVSAVPPERAGAAAAISETGAEFGGVLGIAALGSIGMAVYRGLMAEAVSGDVPVEAAEAAQDTLGGAVAAASQLPDLVGVALLSSARQAFAQGFELVVLICAAIAVAAAVLAAVPASIPANRERMAGSIPLSGPFRLEHPHVRDCSASRTF
jgi:DHA2 family multidrug resistance protein-like MFS transporter